MPINIRPGKSHTVHTPRHVAKCLFIAACCVLPGYSLAQASLPTIPEALIDETESFSLSGELTEIERSEGKRDLNPYGLYLSLQSQQSLEDNGTRQAVGLEWDLLENGWREKKVGIARQELQSTLSETQRQRTLDKNTARLIDARLDAFALSLKHHFASKMLAYIDPLLQRRKRQMEKGFATRTELSDVALKQRKAQLKLKRTEQRTVIRISPELAGLANTIGEQSLKSDSDICSEVEALPEIEAYEALASFTEKSASYWDDASLKVFLEYREIDRQEALGDTGDAYLEGYVAGVNVKLPIFTAQRSKSLTKQRARFHRLSKRDAVIVLHNECLEAIRTFLASQESAQIAEAEYIHLIDRRMVSERKSRADLPGTTENNDRAVETYDYLLLLKEEELVLTRLTALQHLMRLLEYQTSDDINNLLVQEAE